ncbi:Tfp pilus assembly protein FimT/FimU [Vibrio sp. HN007]|uniref:pilus assembly FimT family protein n=1 Tax=Vibrio iocasae TaxID=3098914 RepID=UPI0035D491A2
MSILLISSLMMVGLRVSFEPLLEQLRMRRAASEISSFFFKARSESMLRGAGLYIEISRLSSSDKSWSMELRSEKQEQAIIVVEGSDTRISFSGRHKDNQTMRLYLDDVSGKVMGNGHIRINYKHNENERLRLVYYSITGRTKICGDGSDYYGFPKC